MDKSHNNNLIYFVKVCIAGKKIEIESYNKRVLAICIDYLSSFDKPDFVIRVSREEILKEIKNTNLFQNIMVNDIGCEYVGSESAVIYRKIADKMFSYNIILMHGAAICLHNQCYIFIAPSGTGKTTHVKNWIKAFPEAFVLNGDKPLIDVYSNTVYGTPWCGKEKMNTNSSATLSGIIYLCRGDENMIVKTSFRDIFPILMSQCYIPEGHTTIIQFINLLTRLKDIPFYTLHCNMEVESAKVAYDGLKGDFR